MGHDASGCDGASNSLPVAAHDEFNVRIRSDVDSFVDAVQQACRCLPLNTAHFGRRHACAQQNFFSELSRSDYVLGHVVRILSPIR
jgi:hypothetical protein